MPAVGSRTLAFRVGAGPTDFTSSVKDVRIKSAETDSDFVSFADALAGGARDYTLAITLKQDTAAAALWYYCWDNAGDDVAVEVWPLGIPGAPGDPTASQPCIAGTVTISEPDGDLIGGEANASNTMRFTAEVEWKYTAKPTLYTSDMTP